MAGLILPVSILNNGGIYSDTRGLLLKYFDIKGIVELGSNTFMATGTNTIVLFMQRRNNFVCENMQKIVDSFFVNYKDVVCNGIENIFSKYADYVYGLNIKDYIDFVQ
jgi:type I restriction enzyme M protein